MLRDLVQRSRSIRRFKEREPIRRETLEELVDLGRLSPSGGNVQPLKYMLSCDPASNAKLYPHLRWAGYLNDWDGPTEGERPSAFIVILCDTDIKNGPGCDHGIAAQSIMLGAAERGMGGCMIGALDRDGLRAALDIPERFEIALVLALGTPAETVVLEDVGDNGSIEYYRDADSVHHVPKRTLPDVIITL